MRKIKIKLFLLFFILLNLFFLEGANVAQENLSFVEIDSEQFYIKDSSFKFIGANTVYLVFYDDLGLNLEESLRQASNNDIKVIRIYMDWGGWAKPEDYDRILYLASKYNIYVILTLTDCAVSNDYSSLGGYFKERPFCNIAYRKNIENYKKRIKEIILRENSINGKIYKDDSTIFAWDIANELEYWHFKKNKYKRWIRNVALYIKSIDPNHLVTIGISIDTKGFNNNYMYEILDISELDFFSLHFYPVSNDWSGNLIADSYKEKLEFKIKKFLSIKKPVIIEEFGFSASGILNQKVRFNDDTKYLYYKVLKDSMDIVFSSGASGVMFWGWGVSEVKQVNMWWVPEIHTFDEKDFVSFIKNYSIPLKDE